MGLAAWLASLALVTFQRVPVWTDEFTVWESAAEWAPLKVRPVAELGRLSHLAGDLDAAESYYTQAIRNYDRGRPAHERVGCRAAALNLSTLLQTQGRWTESDYWGGYPCSR